MTDDAPSLPAHFSSFDDTPLPASFSSFDEDTARAPRVASVGTGLSGIPSAPATWADVGHYAAAGAHELGATGAGFAASMSGDPATEAGWRRTVEQQQSEAEQSRAAATPTAQPGWGHPMLWAAEQGPGLAAMALPAAAATAVAGPVGGAAVLGGVMGAQTRGDVYNRLTGEGITPTSGQLAGATALGAATGVASELTGGLVSKLPVSTLVSRALGVTGDSVTFGASGAGQEALSQQAEVAAGQRDRIDPSAVGGAFVGGVEMGAGFAVPHLLLHGKNKPAVVTAEEPHDEALGEKSNVPLGVVNTDPHGDTTNGKTRLPVGGVSAEPTRSGKADARKPEAKVAGRTPDTLQAGPAQPVSPIADPTLAAGAKGETITPESKQQAEPVVQQPTVVQPEPIAAGTATEAPPAGDTTGEPLPPPPPSEAQPAPGAAPALEVVAPEPPSTIVAQHQALLDPSDPREAMIYNKGQQPIELTDTSRFGQTHLKDGRTVQYDKQGPNALTPKKIGQYARTNKLNDLLQYGPVNKDEAVQRASVAGEEPAVVTTTTDAGVPVKEAAGTTATAPAQVAAQEATKGPGDTVAVKPVETLLDRGAAPVDPLAGATLLARNNRTGIELHQAPDGSFLRRSADGSVAPMPDAHARIMFPEVFKQEVTAPVTPESKPPVPTGRVLEAESDSEKAARARQAAAQEAVKGTAVAAAEEAPKPKGKNWTKGELVQKENANQAANEITQRHPPGENEQPNDIYRRAKAMVAEAKGIHVPTEISEEGKHGPGIMLLREAKDLTSKENPSKTAYGTFLMREGMIRRGEFREALEARRAEGKESAALGSPEEGGAEGVRPGQEAEEKAPEPETVAARLRREEAERKAKAYEAELERRKAAREAQEAKEEADLAAQVAARAKASQKSEPQEPKVAVGFQVVKKGERVKLDAAARREARASQRAKEEAAAQPTGEERTAEQKLDEERGEKLTDILKRTQDKTEGEEPTSELKKQEAGVGERGPQTFKQRDAKGAPITVSAQSKSTAREALAKAPPIKIFGFRMRPLVRALEKRITDIAGDTEVFYVTPDEMERIVGDRNTVGFYDPHPDYDHIVINTGKERPETVFHELFHAATTIAINRDPTLSAMIERLRAEALAYYGNPTGVNAILKNKDWDQIAYGFKDNHEFLTHLMTSPVFQDALKKMKISDKLASDLSMPKWRRGTIFNGVVQTIMKALGFKPDQVSVIEAALQLAEVATWRRDPIAGMEFSSRLRDEPRQYQKTETVEEKTPVDASRSPTRYSESMDKITDAVKDRIRDAPALGHTITEKVRNLIDTPRDWMERAKERGWRIASTAERVIDHMGELGADREKILKLSTPVMDRLGRLYNENGNEFGKLARLFVSSTVHGADARDDLGKGLNEHIKVNKKNIEKSNIDHWDAIKGNPKDRVAYNGMKPETQALYNDTMDELKAMNSRVIAATREALATKLTKEMDKSGVEQERKDAVQKVINKEELTKEEQEKYGDDANIKALRSYDGMAQRATRGAYFPLRRLEGTHYVGGEHDYDLPAGASRASNDESSADYHRIMFDSRKDAYNFDPDLPTTPSIRHYIEDANGNRNYVSADEATSTPGAKHGEEYHVTVNNRDVRYVDGYVEGERAKRQMEQAGMKNVSVQPRKNQDVWQYGVNSGHVSSIIRHLGKMDLTDDERTHMTDAIKHVAASSMPGSRLSRDFLHRDRTGGAGGDIIATLDRHRRTSAGLEAMAGHRDEIDEAMEKMKKYVDDHPNHKDAGDMRQMVNMYDDRVNNFQKDSLSDININKRWNAVRAYTTLNDLVSPAFFLLHQLHIPLTVFPDLAARHGIGTATRITLGVMKDMLGAELPTAVKAMGRAATKAWRYNHKPTDFIDALKNEGNLSADERSMIDWGVNHDFAHSTGIDFSQAYVSPKALDKFASKARNFSQEFIGSADAFNKINSALMFHRAALEAGMKGEEAYRYAWDSVARTQGQFTSFQRMGMFRDARMQSVFQYKQYPILMAKTIAKAMYNSFAPGVEWETRARALRTFGLMTLSAGAMSGVQGGTAYPIRMADDLLHLLGITDGWETHMDELRRSLASSMGPEGATAIMDGLGGLAGIYAGHRGGISDPLGINYLLETAKGDQDMYKWLAGPPGGAAHNIITGIGGLMQGNPDVAVKNLLPRIITDPVKAYEEYNQGVSTQRGAIISPPVSAPQAIMKALGLTTITETHAREARAAVGRERTEQQTERQNITKLWQGGDRAGAIAAVHKFNIAYPSQHITVASLSKLTQRPTVLGYPETPKERAKLNERAQAYGLQ